MKIRIVKDKFLLFLVTISILNAIIMFIGGSLLSVKYVLLLLTLIGVVVCNRERMLPLILYLHCNSALYDDIGFKYLFNAAIVIFAIKEIFFYRSKLDKKSISLFIIIICQELILLTVKGFFDFSILSLGSWASSYLLLIVYSRKENDIDFITIYKYFAIGFVMSCICAFSIPLNKWGLDIPVAYRFIGLLRDPNYYSIDALFLIFSAGTYCKLRKKKELGLIILFSVLGALSVSKTFILLLFIGLILKFIFSVKNIRVSSIIISIFSILVIFTLLNQSNYLNIIIKKYTYRTETTSLLTGRDYLQKYYLNTIVTTPSTLLVGNSASKYPYVLGVGSESGREFYSNMVAHNTYLDLILSWGLIGSIIYLMLLRNINYMFDRINFKYIKVKNPDYYVLLIVFLVSLFVLSYLGADAFAIHILYLNILKKSLYSRNKIEKEDNIGMEVISEY